MFSLDSARRSVCVALIALLWTAQVALPQQASKPVKFPFAEKLSYHVEWRLITAGTAILQLSQPSANNWQIDLNLESAGLVTRLYKVSDKYKVLSNEQFCGLDSVLDAQEGKRHRITHLVFQNPDHKLSYEERDVIKNSTAQSRLEVPSCTHEVAGALAALRLMSLEPGKSTTLPITDGKKLVNAKIDAQARESLTVADKTYQTTRYEIFLFDNVLYSRKGRLFIWMTDDAARVPVQFRVQLGFPIGSITLLLDKQEIF